MSKFWMVSGKGPTMYRHPTKRGAEQEAERLARENPGVEYAVLEAVSAVKRNDLMWETLTDPESETPY